MPAKEILDPEGYFRVSVPEDGMKIRLKWLKPKLSLEAKHRLLFLMREAGVVEGIDIGIIDQAWGFPDMSREYLIAEGKPPQPGENGSWEILVESPSARKPEQHLDGTVDFHHVRSFVEVKKGQALARHHPSRPGLPGLNCFGQKVQPPPLVDPTWRLGAGTRFSPDDSQLVIADRKGILQFQKGSLSVEDQLVIQGSVDFHTGDIDVSVPVFVTEDVKAGFELRSKSDVHVGGCIQSARVEAGGSIKIQGGVLGDPSSRIRVKGSFSARYLQNAHVECKGNLAVDKAAVDCVIDCGGILTIGGQVIGSQLLAPERVSISVLGSDLGSPSRVFVGFDSSQRRQLFEICSRRQELQQEVHQSGLESSELKQSAAQKDQVQGAAKTVEVSSEESDLLRELSLRLAKIQEEIFVLVQKEDALLRSGPKDCPKCKIQLGKEIFPESVLVIGQDRVKIESRLAGAREIVQTVLRRAALNLVAIGGESFQKEISSWSEGSQLWGLRFFDPDEDLALVSRSLSPDFVLLEGREASVKNLETFAAMIEDPLYAETIFLFFSKGVNEEFLKSLPSGPRFIQVQDPPSTGLMSRLAFKVGIRS